MFEAIAEPVLVLGVDGVVRRANRAVLVVLELDPVGMSRDVLRERLAATGPDDAPLEAESFLLLPPGDGSVRRERFRITRAISREACTVETTTAPLQENGEEVGVVVVWRDVSEREDLLDMLVAERARLRSVVESMTDAYVVFDGQWRVLEANRVAEERVFGRTAGEIVGACFWDLFPEAVESELSRQARAAMVAGGSTRFEARAGRVDGAWFEVHAYPRRNRLELYLRDITARKRAEEALAESEARFRVLAEAMPQIVWSASAGGSVDYFNQWALRYGGVELAGAAGWSWASFIHPDDLVHTMAAWRRSVETGEVHVCEHRLRRADGAYRWHTSRGTALRDDAGRVTRWIGTSMDIHHQKEAEERARLENVELERRVEERTGQLRALAEVQERDRQAISRELHDEAAQVLASLRLGLQLLEREVPAEVGVQSRLGDLRRAADEVLESLHRLATNLRPASLDRLGLVAALEQHLRTVESRSGMTIHFKAVGLDGRRFLPEVETALYRTVQEAVANVVRHASAANVAVLLEWRDERLLVMVEDDGRGFDPEQARRGGRLGLVGMRERAETIGGSLTVETSPGHGTTVVVDVPCPARQGAFPEPRGV